MQAKLLRVLETKEVCQLGSTRSRSVQINLCSATNKDLRSEVSAGRFREDLYFRPSRPSIELPALRRRLEEIPWLIEAEQPGCRGAPGERGVRRVVPASLLAREHSRVSDRGAHRCPPRALGQEGGLGGALSFALAGREFSAEPPADHPQVCGNGSGPLCRVRCWNEPCSAPEATSRPRPAS